MDLLELRLLLAVAKSGSMTVAANETGHSRATLRRRLENLEARTGAELFRPGAEGTVLTSAGERLAMKAGELLELANALLRSAAEFGPEESRTLRIAMATGSPPNVFLEGYMALRAQLPGLRLDVSYVNTPAELSVSDCDVAIHLGQLPNPEVWITEPATHLRELLVASPAYLDQHGRPASLQELAQHEFLTWKNPDHSHDELPLLEGGHLSIRPKLYHTDNHMLRHLASAGYGIAFVPDTDTNEPLVPPAHLEPVLPEVVGRVVAGSYSVPRLRADVPQVKSLLAALKAFMRIL